MCKVEITESVKAQLQNKGVNVSDVDQIRLINEVNNSNIAVARFNEAENKVVIKESLKE